MSATCWKGSWISADSFTGFSFVSIVSAYLSKMFEYIAMNQETWRQPFEDIKRILLLLAKGDNSKKDLISSCLHKLHPFDLIVICIVQYVFNMYNETTVEVINTFTLVNALTTDPLCPSFHGFNKQGLGAVWACMSTIYFGILCETFYVDWTMFYWLPQANTNQIYGQLKTVNKINTKVRRAFSVLMH